MIQKTEIKGLDIIGSNVDLSGLEVETANDNRRAFLLQSLLKENKSTIDQYDNVFMIVLHL